MTSLRFVNRGLWLPGTRVEVRAVKTAHRKPCVLCAKPPKIRRLDVQNGSGRGAASFVFCMDCGARFIRLLVAEGQRAEAALLNGSFVDPIRLGHTKSPEKLSVEARGLHEDAIAIRVAMRPARKENDLP